MDMSYYYANANEKPLDNIKHDGGFTRLFRTIACIGDSLSSGEFEGVYADGSKLYADIYEYSWGQFIARACGNTVYNFSKGGMTAKRYLETFGPEHDYFNEMKAVQAYIIALGVNDILGHDDLPIGNIEDVDLDNPEKCNMGSFIGCYGKIIALYRKIQPKGKFFLMSTPRDYHDSERATSIKLRHLELLNQIAEKTDYIYVIDLYNNGPLYDKKFRENFYLEGHLNPAGYALTADMVMTYIDYIIRNHPEDFAQVGFIGTPWHSNIGKW